MSGFSRRLWLDEVRKRLEIHLDKISRGNQSMDIIDKVLSCEKYPEIAKCAKAFVENTANCKRDQYNHIDMFAFLASIAAPYQ